MSKHLWRHVSSCALVAIVSSLVATFSANAAVSNGTFETGNLSGWSTAGANHAETAGFGIAPTEGTYMGYIDNTGNFTVAASTIPGTLGVPPSAIAAIATNPPTTASTIYQDITVNAGDVLSFDWNYVSDELNESPDYNDIGFYTVGSSVFLLASRNSSTWIPSAPVGFDGQTGWSTQTYTFTSPGTYRIGFCSMNINDAGHNSVLLVDAVSVTPEPTALGAVLVPIGIMIRRRFQPRRGITPSRTVRCYAPPGLGKETRKLVAARDPRLTQLTPWA